MDVALALDPRIKRIKQEEKEAREAKKKVKSGGQNGLSAKQKAEEDKAEEKARQKQQRVGYLSGISLECGMLTVRMQGAAKLHGDVLVSTSGRSRFAREAG